MKKKQFFVLRSIFIVCFIFGFVALAVQGATTGNVTATVTAQNVALTVSDGNITFGTMLVNTNRNSCQESESQTVTNTGNVNEDFDVKVTSPEGWTTISDTAAGVETYMASYHVDATCPTFSGTAFANTDYVTDIKTAVASSGTFTLDFGIKTPTSTAHYDEQSIVFTVQASAS